MPEYTISARLCICSGFHAHAAAVINASAVAAHVDQSDARREPAWQGSVYCYEVQSETHWNAPYLEAGFLPNTWVDITAHLETKLRALACYESRLRPMPDARSLAVIRALAVWRGSQQSFAATEAFVCVGQRQPTRPRHILGTYGLVGTASRSKAE